MHAALQFFRFLLLPLSCLYGAAVAVRNWCFDKGLLKSRSFAMPVICVGNLTVGGTGKTPHVEHILGLLQGICQPALVSRGYRRRKKGLVLASAASTAADIGDEPFQIKRHFPKTIIAVDANRCEAIERLMQDDVVPAVDAVVLDDAFQHRRVAAGLNLLLVDYNRPVFRDTFLPSGMLRDGFSQRRRADAVVVSKCPAGITGQQCRDFAARMKLQEHQKVFFTSMEYGTPYAVFSNKAMPLEEVGRIYGSAVAVAGIAQPQAFFVEVRRCVAAVRCISFGDHHNFGPGDIRQLESCAAGGAAIITTEKDSARLLALGADMSSRLRSCLYALPVRVKFLFGGEKEFNDMVLDYVAENKRNGGVSGSCH